MPKDYGEPSSDDLSSEWDSDVPDNKNNETSNKESKVSWWSLIRAVAIIEIRNYFCLVSAHDDDKKLNEKTHNQIFESELCN